MAFEMDINRALQSVASALFSWYAARRSSSRSLRGLRIERDLRIGSAVSRMIAEVEEGLEISAQTQKLVILNIKKICS